MKRHKNPLTSENPALASSSFQPGWPKYTVVGKGFPNSAPVMVETPSIIMERRSGYTSPAIFADSSPCSVERKLLICSGMITGRYGTMPLNPAAISPIPREGG